MIPPDFLLHLPLLLVAGVVAGFMNAVAGGASLLTFPLLVFLGLDPRVANATNNFATTVLAIQAFFAYTKRGFSNHALTLRLALPSFLGAVVGAIGVVAMSKEAFSRLVGVLMLGALVVVLYNPAKKAAKADAAKQAAKLDAAKQAAAEAAKLVTAATAHDGVVDRGATAAHDGVVDRGASAAHDGAVDGDATDGTATPSTARLVAGQLTFLALGAYGGLFGGGIGMLILPVLVYFFGQDYLTGNGVKTGVVAVMNITATAIFLYSGVVRFPYALALTAGMMVGGVIGVRWAVGGGEKLIRPLLIAVTLVASIKFLFF